MELVRLRRVCAALGIVYIVWGSTFVATKLAVDVVPPMLLGSLRFLVAGVLLYVWAARRGGAAPGWREWAMASVPGVTMLTLGNGAISWAQQELHTGITSLLVATVPLWMAVLELMRGARLPLRAVVGLLAGFAGVMLLARPAAEAELWPVLVVVLGALAWAGGSLFAREAPQPTNALRAAAMQMVIAGIASGLIGMLLGEVGRLADARITLEVVAAFAYLTVVGSVVAFTAYAWLLRAAPATVVGTYAYVNPLVAVLLGAALLAEPLTPAMGVSGGLIVIGVVGIVTARRPARPRQPAVQPAESVTPVFIEPAATVPRL